MQRFSLDIDRLHKYWLQGGKRTGKLCGSTYAMLVDVIQRLATISAEGENYPIARVIALNERDAEYLCRMAKGIAQAMGYTVTQRNEMAIILGGSCIYFHSIHIRPNGQRVNVLATDHSVMELPNSQSSQWDQAADAMVRWENRVSCSKVQRPVIFPVGGILVYPIGATPL